MSRGKLPTLQDEIIAVLGKSDPLQETLHNEVADQGLRLFAISAGQVSHFCLQLCRCPDHNMTSVYVLIADSI